MMAHRHRGVARAYGFAAAVYVALALLRTAFRVIAVRRPPAAAALTLAQALLLALPWILLTPPVLAQIERMGWVPGRRARIVAAHLGVALGLSLIDGAWSWAATGWLGLPRPASALLWYLGRVDQTVFLYAFLTGAGVARCRLRDLDAVALRAARLEARLLDARLHVLSLQLHPHFLFNTLNAVSELVHRDPDSAAGMARRLRSLLDRSLAEGTAQEVPVREELALLEAYAEIQRIRFQGSLTVTIAVDQNALDVAVPRLVLQPLVENAIRHGTSRRAAPGRVSVRGRCVEGALVLEVEDDGRGLPPGGVREGLGLGNTRARLQELYGAGLGSSLPPRSRPRSRGSSSRSGAWPSRCRSPTVGPPIRPAACRSWRPASAGSGGRSGRGRVDRGGAGRHPRGRRRRMDHAGPHAVP